MQTAARPRHLATGALVVFMTALALTVIAPQAAHAALPDVTAVRGYACDYFTNVGLFGGPQALRGCGSGVAASDPGFSPEVSLLTDATNAPQSASDADGAKAVYGPAVIHGGVWPANVASAPPSGPQAASTDGAIGADGFVTSTADISLNTPPISVPCASGFTPPCEAPGGFGPPPVYGDSLHAECTASESGVAGFAHFSNAFVAKATDADGSPLASATEQVPDDPPVNYTRSGVITNVGDVFTVVFNQQIVNSDGSLTVNAVHMYLFGPTAVGELVRGQVTCGVSPSPVSNADTVSPTCGQPIVQVVSPTDPTPVSPLTVTIGVFDAGQGMVGTGLQSISNQVISNGTLSVGSSPSAQPYLQFTPGQTGPLIITAKRTTGAESSNSPMAFSFDAVDKAGNVTHCNVPAVALINLAVADASIPEGNSGTSTVNVPVTLSQAASQPVTVKYATGYGSATAGSDYVYTEGTLTFTPGQTSKNVSITINGDTTLEANETFFVQLYDPQLWLGVTLSDRWGQVTILNDDAGTLPTVSIADAPPVNESAGPAVFTVTMSAASTSSVTVSYATAYGSATPGVDYTAQDSSVTFAPGETSKPISVPIIDDPNWEPDESFFMQIYNLQGPATLGTHWGMATIVNDDPAPVVSIGDVTATEGNSGTKVFSFPVTLSFPAGPSGARVSWATVSGLGSATPGTFSPNDYRSASGTVTFNSGSSSATIGVTVNGDTNAEPDETFFVQLYNPVGATLGNRWGKGTIQNDDAAPPTISIGDAPSVLEGNSGTTDMSFPVTLSAASTSAVTVSYTTMQTGYNGSTATSGVDYQVAQGTLTIPAGSTTGTIVVHVIGDTTPEPNENLYVQIYDAQNAALNPSARYGQGIILNDD